MNPKTLSVFIRGRRPRGTALLLATCLLLWSCSEKYIPTGASQGARSDSTYVGSWNWIKSIGGFAGTTRTPATDGYTVKIELTRDSVYNVYRDGGLTVSRRFSIHREKNSYSPDSVDVLSYPNDPAIPRQNIMLMSRDTLIIIDQCMDCYNSFYVRATY
jgi:hypothetical protein